MPRIERTVPTPPPVACAQPACLRRVLPGTPYCLRCGQLVARGLLPAVLPRRADLALGPPVARYNRYALVEGDAA
jgi:hypothetical protein